MLEYLTFFWRRWRGFSSSTTSHPNAPKHVSLSTLGSFRYHSPVCHIMSSDLLRMNQYSTFYWWGILDNVSGRWYGSTVSKELMVQLAELWSAIHHSLKCHHYHALSAISWWLSNYRREKIYGTVSYQPLNHVGERACPRNGLLHTRRTKVVKRYSTK